QMFSNGAPIGQIGNITPEQPVIFDSTQNGYVLHDPLGMGYALNTKTCPGVSLLNAGDSGDLCVALSGSNACTQPITLSPPVLTFPPQILRSAPTSQTITLTNNDPSGADLSGLQVSFFENSGSFSTVSDFTGLSNFTEKDNCANPPGSPFTLAARQSCTI